MIIESWLNERATNESRGMIFSFYISITLLGVVGGQMTVALADIQTQTLFLMAGIYYCFAMLPTLVSNAQSPKPLNEVRLDLVALYRNSPVSFIGILLVASPTEPGVRSVPFSAPRQASRRVMLR